MNYDRTVGQNYSCLGVQRLYNKNNKTEKLQQLMNLYRLYTDSITLKKIADVTWFCLVALNCIKTKIKWKINYFLNYLKINNFFSLLLSGLTPHFLPQG